jgi:YgiT-type zinc finger domain-containing protein
MSLLELTVKEDIDGLWHRLSEEVMTGMVEWRMQHPKATLTEIENALDERLSKMRARMLEDLALASAAVKVNEEGAECPECGGKLESRGQKTRKLKTHHNRDITLRRGYGKCPKCGAGFFPPR